MATNNASTIEVIKKNGLLPMYYYDNIEVAKQVIDILYAAGIFAVEYTNRGEKTEEIFKELIAYRDANYPDLLIGAGTIKKAEDAALYIDLGASFISSPGMIKEIGKTVQDKGALWIPGCMTISEIMEAEICGATVVKLCPASILKSSFLVGIKNIFPKIAFIPMGGLDVDRYVLTPWLDAGAASLSIGSRLLGKALLDNKAFDIIELRVRKALSIIKLIASVKQEEKQTLDEIRKKTAI
ncbi:beta/alpha barrel domain-containing protein [Rhizosphaericola mali]|uniref:Bifunctional 4-hydroxy-2-oxoglutarate aldolase/2-dehydro-3-deoxy-phosphogluconate aldolase n=1 Tax=Rhizosphaericola mali TaxID=2545455 RepID=A0A5P2G198_9BACT|nr:bifunctional 4-hydroxy-2-oxoglutarate aldolase/2-dehydro-3-deoxy-phosphogluconate aldolase [Rhizosphaericola mali]QES88458.1 bifunctional 4-hydroxy-2-oxoglutarate aldolase/2-dehydro-3-deoxy-phosphogluconate aldolase [Rhizosphaericola mali]